ncbi:MAG: hypothetical protein AAGE80_03735 [Pseudomonadota bacterium]
MSLDWRDLPRYVAACAISICATAANAEGEHFHFSVESGGLIEGSSSITPADPDLCGTDLGWIETVSSRTDAKVEESFLPGGDRIRVRKGGRTDTVRIGSAAPTAPHSGVMTTDYRGCVTPSGMLLLSLQVNAIIETGDCERKFSVTYDEAALPIKWRFAESDLAKFTVESDRGEAILSRLRLPIEPYFSSELHKAFRIEVRLESKGATQ